MKVLELFGGIGACTQALNRIGMDVEVADYVEIDKYAVASYNAINGTNFEPQDICTWDKNIEVDLIMHGSPCQDFSVAGKQAGGDIGSGTRSSLMYETIRIVGKLRPKYVIWENVKNLLSAKHRHNFDAYLETMKALGYVNYYQVLNAKDYGIPQNRERVFTISIKKDIDVGYEFPKAKVCQNKIIKALDLKSRYEQSGRVYNPDGIAPTVMSNSHIGGYVPIKITENFAFPEKQPLELRLKDLLEDKVEEKYYLSERMIEGFKKHNAKHEAKGTGFIWKVRDIDGVASTLRANASLAPTDNTIKCEQVGTLDIKGMDCVKRVYSDEGLSPTLTDMQGGNRQPKIIENISEFPCIGASRGRNLNNPSDRTPGITTEQRLEINTKGTSNAITTVQKDNYVIENNDYRIRKLTPKECWRLMGFDDESFEKAAQVNSNTQLYKQAGNSIVVNVLEEIFKNLF